MTTKRNKEIKIRFTEDEFFKIENAFKQSDVKTRVEFLRTKIFSAMQNKNIIEEKKTDAQLEIKKDDDTEKTKTFLLNKILNELSRIGNNVNQLAKEKNSEKHFNDLQKFEIEIVKLQIEFVKLKNEIHKMNNTKI